MQKIFILILIALAASIAAVVVITRGANAGFESPDNGPYKCYEARHAKRTPRFQSERVFLTDQFRDNVHVQVLKLATHCSRAGQSDSDGLTASFDERRGLNCYNIRDVPRQPRFRSQNILVHDLKFGPQTLTVSKPSSLCVSGYKGGTDSGLRLEGGGFVCYQAKTAKGQTRFQQRDIGIFDQYGHKAVRIIRPTAYCARTEKKLDADNDDIEDAQELFKDLLKGGNPSDYHSSTVHATLEDDPIISCKTDYSHSVWYYWRSVENKSLIFDTEGTTYDTALAAFSGPPGDLEEVGCNDDADPCNLLLAGQTAGNCLCPDGSAAGVECCRIAGSPCESPITSLLQLNALANTDYYILVASSEDRGGKLKLRVSSKSDGPDACSTITSPIGALTVVGQSLLAAHVSTMNAGPNLASAPTCPADAPPVCSKTPEHTVWFNYTVPNDQHQRLRVDASESSYETVVAVYDAHAQLLACGNGTVTPDALLAGQTYRFMIGDVDPDEEGGKLKLWLTLEDAIGGASASGGEAAALPPPNGMVCYQVRQSRHSAEPEIVEDQFSRRQVDGEPVWSLLVGGVKSVCMPSWKETCTRFEEVGFVGRGDAAQLCIRT